MYGLPTINLVILPSTIAAIVEFAIDHDLCTIPPDVAETIAHDLRTGYSTVSGVYAGSGVDTAAMTLRGCSAATLYCHGDDADRAARHAIGVVSDAANAYCHELAVGTLAGDAVAHVTVRAFLPDALALTSGDGGGRVEWYALGDRHAALDRLVNMVADQIAEIRGDAECEPINPAYAHDCDVAVTALSAILEAAKVARAGVA